MRVKFKVKVNKHEAESVVVRRANRRAEPRDQRDDPVRVFVDNPDGSALVASGDLVNLSKKGALVRADESLKPGQECLLTIVGASGDVVIDAAFATVRWSAIRDDRFLIGIAFEKEPDAAA